MKEKFDKKKIIILGVVLALVIGLLVVFLVKKDGEVDSPEKVDVTPVNSQVDLVKVFEEIEKIEGIGNGEMLDNESLENPETSGVESENSEDEMIDDNKSLIDESQENIIPEEEIDFGKYEGLEKKAIVKTTDDQVNEVWMIKLGNIKQQEEVCRILGNRLQKLKNAFSDDEVQMNLLKRAVIKQEDGVVIMIASPQDNEIEKTIAEAMKK